jgi:hypothetical protein
MKLNLFAVVSGTGPHKHGELERLSIWVPRIAFDVIRARAHVIQDDGNGMSFYKKTGGVIFYCDEKPVKAVKNPPVHECSGT